MHIFAELARRQQTHGPIRLAVVGTGYFGAGLLRRGARIRGLASVLAANRTLERAVAALQAAGHPPDHIRVCDDPLAAQAALEAGCAVATADLCLAARVPGVEVVMEATGDVLVGATVASAALQGGKHVVAANPETQATVGPLLQHLAEQAGVVYSDVDGDEPGILKNLWDYCVGLGFEPIVAGNCKGVLKRYATPATQAAYAEAHGLKPWIASAAADGTKLSLEMCTVANATGHLPAAPGMVGPQTSLETLIADFDELGLLSQGPLVEYTLGIPNGVFVVVRGDGDPQLQRDFSYLKMGDGPYYLFHRPHVLVHYEAPLSAAEAVLYGAATVAPRGAPVAEVATFAKRDLPAGQRLDGIGGFDCYGLIVRADHARRERLLPVGLASYARLTRPIPTDAPIPIDAVDFEDDNLVLQLRRQQDALFAAV
jgi:predicted homoserine dehydrogenase-like protein